MQTEARPTPHARRVADATRLLEQLLDRTGKAPKPPRRDDPDWYREAAEAVRRKIAEAQR